MEEKPVHRCCHDDIPGANWRPTRFVSMVPSSYVCSICGMIPKSLVKLPCSHVLCSACHATNSDNGAGQCPLEKQPFERADSVSVNCPVSKIRRLKAHCWNEAQGCDFVGSVETLLKHYEHDCTYHVVECLKCAQAVLHKDLSKHHENGCGGFASQSAEESSPSESAAGTPKDTLEDPGMLLQDPCCGLPAIMTLMSKVVQRAKEHEVLVSSCTNDFRASMLKLKTDMAQMSKLTSETPSHSNELGVYLSELDNTLVFRKLEHFAHSSLKQLELMRQIVSQPAGHRSVIVNCEPIVNSMDECRRLSNALSIEDSLNKEILKQIYSLCFENAEELFSCALVPKKLADVTIPFTRDTYFTIVVSKRTTSVKDTGTLYLDIQFNGLLEESRCILSNWTVRVKHPNSLDLDLEGPKESYCNCMRVLEKYEHFHRGFSVKLDDVRSGGFLRNGCLTLEIQFDEPSSLNTFE
ncbi:hypothetical protein MRX96_057879 [Rhipicephalus microplus]|uniref:uncharacterized protein LOC119161080 n=1 Tax=Rhipicephalus microplus TaxID=6941 RepID=UPI003F6AAE11